MQCRKLRQEVFRMKPIELTLRGLNSFREEQHIDFETLCADGIFGIFGPTGSGKSTILDAITLALYGTVERAANNTQGILNQLEDQLSVSFTFELNGAGTRRYQVARSYKRVKNNGLRLAFCRLLRLDTETRVLADKERDVTQKIQEILGLTHDDFTRAVVLPQGKFAEFLSLKGNERRKMLQRLFHLEKYGDALNARLKAHAEETRQKLESIVERETLLGDASREALDALSKRTQQTKATLMKQREAMEKEQQVYHTMLRISEMEQERDKKQDDRKLLQARRGSIQQMKQQLLLDQAAEQLMPYLDALIRAETEESDAASEAENLSERYRKAKEDEQAKKHIFDANVQKFEEQEPVINESVKKIQNSLTLQRQIRDLETSIHERHQQTELLTRQIEEGKKIEQQITQQIEENGAELEIAEKERESLFLSSEERHRLQKARDCKKELENLEEQIKTKRGEWSASHKEWLRSKQSIEQLKISLNPKGEETRKVFSRFERDYFRVSALLDEISRSLRELALQKERDRKSHEQQTIQSLAYTLAMNLKDGDPCPVCGSLHHPDLSHETDLDEDDWNHLLSGYQNAEQAMSRAEQECRVDLSKMEQLARNFADLIVSEPTSDVMEQHDPPENFSAILQEGSLSLWAHQLNANVKALRQDVIESCRTIELYHERVQQLKLSQSNQEARLSFYQEQKEEIERQAMKLKTTHDALRNAWPEAYPPIEKAESAFQTIQLKDRQREKLEKTIQDLRKVCSDLDEKRSACHNKNNAMALELNRLQGQTETDEEQYNRRVGEWTLFGFSVADNLDEILKQTETRLRQLREKKENSETEWRDAWRILVQLEKALDSARQRLQRAKETFIQLSNQWTEKLSTSNFVSSGAVKDAVMEPALRENFKSDVATFEEREAALITEIRTLEEKLAGQHIDKEAVAISRDKVETLKESVQTLTEESGALANQLTDLRQRHKIYQTLQTERRESEKAADQFEKLQRVFRGNAFVAYVAGEQLQQVCIAASDRLGDLTHGRYALESDTFGNFFICDNGNGGVRRPVSSLSGGETFLTSLALALSLSEQIQLNGNVPLQFFFLDEGFGTLDPGLLDTVLTALEKLHMRRLAIGVISHVPEMRERLPRQLIVEPAEPSGKGSHLHLEML